MVCTISRPNCRPMQCTLYHQKALMNTFPTLFFIVHHANYSVRYLHFRAIPPNIPAVVWVTVALAIAALNSSVQSYNIRLSQCLFTKRCDIFPASSISFSAIGALARSARKTLKDADPGMSISLRGGNAFGSLCSTAARIMSSRST